MYSDRESYYTHLLALYNVPKVTAVLKHHGPWNIKVNIDTDSGIYYANNGQIRKLIFGKFRY
ncbi:MAG TPA: hypothetical protein VMV86_01550 [Methanosarcinales archaeon]|nr:hypothetical protein [Methanosarcinales archaeon]